MLPYVRTKELEDVLYAMSDTPETLNMIYTPYSVNARSSLTDNYRNADTNSDINYRYSAFSYADDSDYKDIFSSQSINWISNQITIRLKGVHPEGKNIVVPDKTILSVLDSFWNKTFKDSQRIREQVVLYIVDYVKNDFQVTEQNDKLSPWVQLYSEDTGLKRFNDIKLAERRPTHYYSWHY